MPEQPGLETIDIAGTPWRSLTLTRSRRLGNPRLQIASSLAPVEERVSRTRRLVLLLGAIALALTALAAWGLTTLAVRPLARLRGGAARIRGAEDLSTPLADERGAPDEVRQLAGALNEMLARLGSQSAATERALEATRRFAADAGHELRTPLTALRAQLDTLARNPELPLDQREALVADMTAEQDRMVHLLEGLQALARGEAAESLPREPVELGDVLDAAVHGARKRHPGVHYELAGRVDEGTVDGWEGGLRLLVDNLLDNAALHGRPARQRRGRARARQRAARSSASRTTAPASRPDQRAPPARAVRSRRATRARTAPASASRSSPSRSRCTAASCGSRLEPRRARRRGPLPSRPPLPSPRDPRAHGPGRAAAGAGADRRRAAPGGGPQRRARGAARPRP